MESGGDLLRGDAMLFHPIDIDGPCIDSREQLRCIQPPEGLLRDLLLDHTAGAAARRGVVVRQCVGKPWAHRPLPDADERVAVESKPTCPLPANFFVMADEFRRICCIRCRRR